MLKNKEQVLNISQTFVEQVSFIVNLKFPRITNHLNKSTILNKYFKNNKVIENAKKIIQNYSQSKNTEVKDTKSNTSNVYITSFDGIKLFNLFLIIETSFNRSVNKAPRKSKIQRSVRKIRGPINTGNNKTIWMAQLNKDIDTISDPENTQTQSYFKPSYKFDNLASVSTQRRINGQFVSAK